MTPHGGLTPGESFLLTTSLHPGGRRPSCHTAGRPHQGPLGEKIPTETKTNVLCCCGSLPCGPSRAAGSCRGHSIGSEEFQAGAEGAVCAVRTCPGHVPLGGAGTGGSPGTERGVRPGQAQAGPALPHPRPQEPRPPPQWPSAGTAEGSTISSGASSRRGECRLRAAVTPRLAGRTPDGGRGLRWAGWPRCPDLSQATLRTRHSRDRLCLVSATMCPTFLNGSGVPSGGPDIGGAKVNGSRSVPESPRQGWAPGWTYSLI